ncbi:hypothetical protein I6B53_10435 [Schaalia sp. 19OD2882]|uniref:hypothetical protein n=1 Tax=Schaalia sp. 19OD2882 TaxID=2794089 RepID=UPI001C1F06F2|nr:hypothetical protein [Schaalia sp. 19OD2882]QWW19480.1 hypothetical protein I6B53_10435 [Schaalia sp. 19OD2882]
MSARSSTGQAFDDFDDRTVVASSRTVVDVDTLAASCQHIGQVADLLWNAANVLVAARDQLAVAHLPHALAERRHGALAALEQLIDALLVLEHRLRQHGSDLGYALVVLAAADEDAARFSSLHERHGPGVWGLEHATRTGAQATASLERLAGSEAASPQCTPTHPCTHLDRMALALDREQGFHPGSSATPGQPIPDTPSAAEIGPMARLDTMAWLLPTCLGPASVLVEQGKRQQWLNLWGRHGAEFTKGTGDGTLGPRVQSDLGVFAGQVVTNPEHATKRGAVAIEKGRGLSFEASRVAHDIQQAAASAAGVSRFIAHGDAGRTTGVTVESAPAGRYTDVASRTRVPQDAIELLSRIEHHNSSGEKGLIEILEHHNPDGSRSWSVVVTGTQDWGVTGTNPQDLRSNFESVARMDSDQREAILEAMSMAGIRPGEPVEMVGHSQSGILVSQLAADQEVLDRYQVVSVLTAGSPTAGYAMGSGVRRLCLENTRDIVPSLDGAENPAGPNGRRATDASVPALLAGGQGETITVHFDGETLPGVEQGDWVPKAHNRATYVAALGALKRPGSMTGSEVQQWDAWRRHRMHFDAGTRTKQHLYQTKRITPVADGPQAMR